MSQPVILVTGASSGIGLSTSVAAARAGYRTVATMRNLDKAGPLRTAAGEAGVEVDVRRLDVVDEQSIRSCIGATVDAYGRLDAVVNNAGAGHLGTIDVEPVSAVRHVMEVNFFGVVMVTKEVLPHLRAGGGRLVTVTSVGGVVGQPFNEAYCAAKFAVEGFMESLAPVAASVGVRVSVVEPGAVSSEFVANVDIDLGTALAEAGPYEPALRGYLHRVMTQFGSAQTPDDAAAVITGLLSDPEPPFRVQTSAWAEEFVGTKLADLDGSAVIGTTGSWIGDG